MTCLAAGLGLLPAAITNGIGAQAQQPLARVVVGGMVTTALAVLFPGTDDGVPNPIVPSRRVSLKSQPAACHEILRGADLKATSDHRFRCPSVDIFVPLTADRQSRS